MDGISSRTEYYDRVHLNYWGYSEGNPDILMDFHEHDFFQLNCTLQGSCEFRTEQGTFLTRRNEMIFIAPGVKHQLVYPEKYLGFCCKFHWSSPEIRAVHYISENRFSQGIIEAARNILEATFPEEFFGNLRGAIIKPDDRYQLIMEHFLTGVMNSLQAKSGWENLPIRIAEARKRQPEAFYSVAEAARACGWSGNHFSRIIREATGLTAQQFLAAERLREAKALLRHSNCSIREIAGKIHFSSPFHFAEFFKRMTGCTPSRFRRSLRE